MLPLTGKLVDWIEITNILPFCWAYFLGCFARGKSREFKLKKKLLRKTKDYSTPIWKI